MATPPFFVKQGALLSLALQFVQDDGTPVNITGATVQSQIRDKLNNLIATPTLVVTDAALGQISYTAQTDDTWPVGPLQSDVYFLLNGAAMFTETFAIRVVLAVTQVST